jgi:hypothetical protein
MRITKTEKQKREEARSIITDIVLKFCSEYGYQHNRIAIKNQKTRLGSCSSYGNLNFNWQIVKFPQNILEYIIKHEIAHLKHHNHSKNFWSAVSEMDNNYKTHHKWIKENVQKYLKFS